MRRPLRKSQANAAIAAISAAGDAIASAFASIHGDPTKTEAPPPMATPST